MYSYIYTEHWQTHASPLSRRSAVHKKFRRDPGKTIEPPRSACGAVISIQLKLIANSLHGLYWSGGMVTAIASSPLQTAKACMRCCNVRYEKPSDNALSLIRVTHQPISLLRILRTKGATCSGSHRLRIWDTKFHNGVQHQESSKRPATAALD